MTQKAFKVLWAIDAFPDDVRMVKTTAQVIKNLKPGYPLEIQPVHVLHLDHLDVLEVARNWTEVEDFKRGCKRAIEALLKGIKIPGLKAPMILPKFSTSVRDGIRSLVKYASGYEYDLIVAGTHGRKGLERWALGSFAETLLLKSSIPVLVVPPGMKATRSRKQKILFPTDLSEASQLVFERVVSYAKHSGASIELLHCVPNLIEPLLAGGMTLFGGGWVPAKSYFSKRGELAKEQLELLVDQAADVGVKASYFIHFKSDRISDAIVKRGKKMGASLIAMSSQVNQIDAALLGSNTRQVIRNSVLPVWVLHQDEPAESEQLSERDVVHVRSGSFAKM